MASKYIDTQPAIGWHEDDGNPPSYIIANATATGVTIDTSSPPVLDRENVADLRDWLTAWLERTER